MRFEYEGETTDKECVAYIDNEGDLIINTESNGWVIIGGENSGESYSASPDENSFGVKKKFYPGDKITITF